jgi:hypothetical protein
MDRHLYNTYRQMINLHLFRFTKRYFRYRF